MAKCSWDVAGSCSGAAIEWRIYRGKVFHLCLYCSMFATTLIPESAQSFKTEQDAQRELLRRSL